MDGNSQAYRGSSAQPIRPSRFAYDVEQLFGDNLDLDPLFLEECWTVGKPAALENLRRRRLWQVERERQSRALREFEALEAHAYVNVAGCSVESFLADRAAAVAGGYGAAWAQQRPEQIARPGASAGLDASAGAGASRGAGESGMTLARAQAMLGVTAGSSREQVRSAYRRRVSQCHPDRLQNAGDAVREGATRQLAELNQAYGMLRDARVEIAA